MIQPMGGVAYGAHLWVEPGRVKKSQMKVQEEGAGDEMPKEGELTIENQVNKVRWKRSLVLFALKKALK